tara:strand:+ start:11660 stop:12787 length:1128 start_codon:yes stop_codon:yes gene_type:complete
MSGIYIHIPFCSKACHYCDFHFSTSLKSKEKVINGIVNEINLRKNDFKLAFSSLYFGGGTPSILKKEDLNKIIDALKEQIKFENLKEITIEINPEDISSRKLEQYRELGFNRLSIGVQSMDNKYLKWMNRSHSKNQIVQAINICKSVGFSNLSLDFIYGLPTHFKRDYKTELLELIELNPTHISCYHLTIEKGTYFEYLKNKNKFIEIEDDKSEEEFLWISNALKMANFNHYEISSFSKKGYDSFHNSNYWKQRPYVGIGPSAHSFSSKKRRWNISNNNTYCNNIKTNKTYFDEEILSALDIFNERIMLGLRTEKGVKINEVSNYINKNQRKIFQNKLDNLINDGLVILKDKVIKIPQNKWLMSEYVSRELFILK